MIRALLTSTCVLLAASALSCRGATRGGDGALVIQQLRLDDGPVAHLELALMHEPPGDVKNLYVLIGADLLRGGNRYLRWPELMELDGDPSTTADTRPRVGQTISVDVPLSIEPNIVQGKRSSSARFTVIVTAFWGTNDEGPIDQSRAEDSLERFYRRQLMRADPPAMEQ